MRLLITLLVFTVIGCRSDELESEFKSPTIDNTNGQLDRDSTNAIVSLLNHVAKRENAEEISLDARSLATSGFSDELIFHEDTLKKSYGIDARKLVVFFRDGDLRRGIGKLPASFVIKKELNDRTGGIAISLPVFIEKKICVIVAVEHLQKSKGMRLYVLRKMNDWEVRSNEVLSVF